MDCHVNLLAAEIMFNCRVFTNSLSTVIVIYEPFIIFMQLNIIAMISSFNETLINSIVCLHIIFAITNSLVVNK